jgi:hypothetical protein
MPLLTVAITVVLPIVAATVSVLLVFGGALAAVVMVQALAALADRPTTAGAA